MENFESSLRKDDIKKVIDLLKANDGDEASKDLVWATLEAVGLRKEVSRYIDRCEKKTYSVDYAVRGYHCIYVDASDRDEAQRIADEIMGMTSFGMLEETNYECIDVSEEE